MEKQTTDVLIVAARLRSQDAQNQIKTLDQQSDALREKRDTLHRQSRALGINCTEQRKRTNDTLNKVLKDLECLSSQRAALIEQRQTHDKEFNALRLTGESAPQTNSAQVVCDKAYQDYVSGLGDSSSKATPQELAQQSAGVEKQNEQPSANADPDQAYADYVASFNQPEEKPTNQAADLNWH